MTTTDETKAIQQLITLAENQLDQAATHNGLTNADVLAGARGALVNIKSVLKYAQETIAALVMVVNDVNTSSFYLEESFTDGDLSVHLECRYGVQPSFDREMIEGATAVYMLYGAMEQQGVPQDEVQEND